MMKTETTESAGGKAYMKRNLAGAAYIVLVCLTILLTGQAVRLYPDYAANGTSAAYFTVILFPAVFLLTGLMAVVWRYWLVLSAGGILALSIYLALNGWMEPNLLVFLFVYLLLAGAAGMAGGFLRKCRRKR